MKTILILIVGLMLAGCGSMENHVRNRDAVYPHRYLVARYTLRVGQRCLIPPASQMRLIASFEHSGKQTSVIV